MYLNIVIIFISIAFSAFFSGMEIAYVSANKFQLELQKKKEGFISKIFNKITANSSKFITTMLVGNSIALVVYSLLMGELVVGLLPIYNLNEISILLIQTCISTLIILLTAEFLPKAVFRIYANEMLWFFAPLAYFFYIIFHYVSSFVTSISNFILKYVFKVTLKNTKTEFGKKDLGNYISKQLEQAKDSEEVDAEIQIFQNALEFDTVKAREIMVPRTEIVAVDINENLNSLKNLFVKTGYSKIIVYKTSLDEILGYVHAFELFKTPKSVKEILRPIEFIPESMMINNVLSGLIKKKKSIAVVLDEFGGTSGIITVEDIIEELFGDIIDEHDTVVLLEKEITKNEYEFSSRLNVDYLNETYHFNIPENEAYETLGGYIVYFNEDIPKQGEILQINNLEFTMLKVDASKIIEVRLKIIEELIE